MMLSFARNVGGGRLPYARLGVSGRISRLPRGAATANNELRVGVQPIRTMPQPPLAKSQPRTAPFSAVVMGGAQQQATFREVFNSDKIREALTRFSEAMVRPRQPLTFIGMQTTTNLSNLCGHASFVALAIAYMETDVLTLRALAAGGVTLAIMFQYYRAQPLWISIGWNTLFLVTNAVMIGLLVKERNDAQRLAEDEEHVEIFQELFEPYDLSPVDFVRLMDLSTRTDMPKGTKLSEEGKEQDKVYLIIDGNAQVTSKNIPMCRLQPGQFVGSMSFTRFTHRSAASEKTGSRRFTPHMVPEKSYESYTQRPAKEGEQSPEDRAEDEHYIDDSYTTDSGSGVFNGGAIFVEAKDAVWEVLHKPSIMGELARSLVSEEDFVAQELRARPGAAGLEKSVATVTATSDVTVYAWDMHILRAFIRRRPMAGAALHKTISADLNRKVDQSRTHGERYRMLLSQTLDGGVITPIERQKLHKYRTSHGITDEEHEELLSDHGWEAGDFNTGFQTHVHPKAGSKHFLKYEAMLQRELANGKVTEEGRQNLLIFRAQAGINAQEHLLALEKQGWTADDYEAGAKGKAAELESQAPKIVDTVPDPILPVSVSEPTSTLTRRLTTRARAEGLTRRRTKISLPPASSDVNPAIARVSG